MELRVKRNTSYKGVKKSVDPDQLASEKPADLYLHCFQSRIYRSGFIMVRFHLSRLSTISVSKCMGYPSRYG